MKNRPATSRDPVCGMTVLIADSTPTASRRGIAFHFCSAQCRERFVATPALNTAPVGNKDAAPITKRRRLCFVSPGSAALLGAADELRRMMGIAAAIPDGDGLVIEYNLHQATLEQIEAALSGAGLVLRSGVHGWRRALWRFTERNEVENAALPANGSCCNRPPNGRR
ncbi:MAG: hypothetical protein CVU18_15215 [Betaproteobacteria bacterium HGW-Betaproteobacteria-12]|nr:MAG: hypothetical protein CVU18_15215 [Betaproteobacteria bacterium HGW-Betaproteobacteria-12]